MTTLMLSSKYTRYGIAAALPFLFLASTLAPAAKPARIAPFDFLVATGQTVVFDITLTNITSTFGDTASFPNGMIFFDNLTVQPGGTIIGQGPNPLRIIVKNSAQIHGKISVNGADAPDVVTILTSSAFSSPGGLGHGGRGGKGLVQIHTLPANTPTGFDIIYDIGQGPVTAISDPSPFFGIPKLSGNPARDRELFN